MEPGRFKQRLGEVLHSFARGEVTYGSRGYGICCPFHEDSKPSCTVFYDTGVFFCLANCGKKPLGAGLRKLGVPPEIIEEFKRKGGEETPRLSPLVEGEIALGRDTSRDRVGIVSEEPWPWEEWGYREIRPGSLLSAGSCIHETFKPSLVRLWTGSKGKRRQERFKRLCLRYGPHAVYARLAAEQKVKYYNSSGLDMSDPKLHPFGLRSFSLPKNLAGLILTEGPYDVLRTMQNLEDLGVMESFAVVGLLGVAHWDSFFKKLATRLHHQMRGAPLLFAFDNDRAGKDLTERAREQCRAELHMPPNKLLVLPFEKKDLGELWKNDLKTSLLAVGY